MKIPTEFLKQIREQAEKEYPEECCGMILGPADKPEILSRLRPCKNAQEKYHAQDAASFPRTARTAYFIDAAELLDIQKEARRNGEEVRVIYHSHIDADAYFSDEDKRIAAPDGEPAYPGVDYLVIPVMEGKAGDFRRHLWNPEKKDFVERAEGC